MSVTESIFDYIRQVLGSMLDGDFEQYFSPWARYTSWAHLGVRVVRHLHTTVGISFQKGLGWRG